MNEFQLIENFFKSIPHRRNDVIFGIGDDAACLQVASDKQLLVSCDTLVAGVHFLEHWDAYDIATKAVMVNLSDIAAMGAEPAWMTLSLTLPTLDETWLQRFANGLSAALTAYNVALVGGDTTRGPLSMTLTVHGLVAKGCAIMRSGAQDGDLIYVSGPLGAAAKALSVMEGQPDYKQFMQHLHNPKPRVDFASILQKYATAAIDISDGLAADLAHICKASSLGACLLLDNIPINKLLKDCGISEQLNLAMHGGDDYELCFTINPSMIDEFLQTLAQLNLVCYPIGKMELQSGLRVQNSVGNITPLEALGYKHF